MEMSGFLNTLLSSTYFYAALAVVVLLIVYAIYRNGVIKGIKNHLTELDKSFTNINTIPLAFMMNKATALARTNEQAKKVVEEIGPKYQQAISELSGLHELLENSEDYIATKNYKEAKQANQEMGRRLSSVEEIVYEVKDALDSVVKQEQKQRDEINVIKDDFHDVKISFAENSNNYVYSYDALQLNIVEIEK